jgi:hypothetical protein
MFGQNAGKKAYLLLINQVNIDIFSGVVQINLRVIYFTVKCGNLYLKGSLFLVL